MRPPSRSTSVAARPLAAPGQLHRPALEIGPAAELGQPVGERQRGVAQRARERVAQLDRRRIGAQLDEQVADRRAGEARVEQPDQERDRARGRSRRT